MVIRIYNKVMNWESAQSMHIHKAIKPLKIKEAPQI